jgi:hypothetical protein
VFDVGEAEGTVFHSIEFVQAQDFAALPRRVAPHLS